MHAPLVGGQHPHRTGKVHGLVEPSRHLIGAGVPVGRHVGVGAAHGNEPGAAVGGEIRQAIAPRHVKAHSRAAVTGVVETKRQRRRDRPKPVASNDEAEAAVRGKGEARGPIGMKAVGDVHGGAPGSMPEIKTPQNFFEKMPRSSLRRRRRRSHAMTRQHRPGKAAAGNGICVRNRHDGAYTVRVTRGQPPPKNATAPRFFPGRVTLIRYGPLS
jgi:hypothetical protein